MSDDKPREPQDEQNNEQQGKEGEKFEIHPEDKIPKPWDKWGANTRWGTGQAQPSSESKKEGWKKRRRNRELAQLLLGLKYVGEIDEVVVTDKNGNEVVAKKDSKFKKQLRSYFGLTAEQVEETSNEVALMLRMIGQAVEDGDVASANLILERAYGRPKEYVEISDDEEKGPVMNVTVITLPNQGEIKESENDTDQQRPRENEGV